MAKFESSSPLLLKRIDELTLLSHFHLKSEDEIYYLGEYTSGERAAFSEVNRLILNYKKPMNRMGMPDWDYKERAIQDAADRFRLSIAQTKEISVRAQNAILVPIPPSAAKDSAAYDDRNLKLLRWFMPLGNICELLAQKQSRAPLHSSKNRAPQQLFRNMAF